APFSFQRPRTTTMFSRPSCEDSSPANGYPGCPAAGQRAGPATIRIGLRLAARTAARDGGLCAGGADCLSVGAGIRPVALVRPGPAGPLRLLHRSAGVPGLHLPGGGPAGSGPCRPEEAWLVRATGARSPDRCAVPWAAEAA